MRSRRWHLVRQSIEDRLAELATLQPGWLDGEGEAIMPTTLARALHLFRDLKPRPYLYPTPDGSVQAEWSFSHAVGIRDLVVRLLDDDQVEVSMYDDYFHDSIVNDSDLHVGLANTA